MRSAACRVACEEGISSDIGDFPWVLFERVQVGKNGGPRACLMHGGRELHRFDPHRIDSHFHLDPMNTNGSHRRLSYEPASRETALDFQIRRIGNLRVVHSWLRAGGFERLAPSCMEDVASRSRTLPLDCYGLN